MPGVDTVVTVVESALVVVVVSISKPPLRLPGDNEPPLAVETFLSSFFCMTSFCIFLKVRQKRS